MKNWTLMLAMALPLAACGPKTTDDTDDTDDTDIEDTDVEDTDVEDTDVEDTDVEDTDDTDVDPNDMDGDGYTVAEGDCDDSPATGGGINPGATEIAGDGIDQDCNGLHATVDVSCHEIDNDDTEGPDVVTGVRMVGVFWNNFDPVAGPVATDNGDGTWSVLFEDAPTADMEYLWSINGAAPYENLIDDMQGTGTCAPVTDYSSYANRKWFFATDGDISDTLSSCTPCP